ncbi:MAG: large repetitive protein, partial [Actinomycetota bacterium]
TTVIAKTTGYLAGSIKQGGTFYVYANINDATSGVGTVTADISSLVASGGSVPLSAGSFSVEGVSYNYRSSSQTAKSLLSTGSYSITSTDEHGNTATSSALPVTIDNTAPFASDVQTTNVAGGTNGKAELGDTITFTYSEPIDPTSIVSTWTTGTSNVVVHLIDGGCLVGLCHPDTVEIWDAANSGPLPLGSVNLNTGGYNGAIVLSLSQNPDITFGATGTASTMVRSGNSITVTLGTASSTAHTSVVAANMQWTPSTSAYDAAGNGTNATTPATESGSTADNEF